MGWGGLYTGSGLKAEAGFLRVAIRAIVLVRSSVAIIALSYFARRRSPSIAQARALPTVSAIPRNAVPFLTVFRAGRG